ncbi:MAG: T9SS type A sorting domain-containing protein [Gemmatimonadetes bacterium]|nr:T9SS type A sorting domain-containing protein [Gemmatimonadota bacterium]
MGFARCRSASARSAFASALSLLLILPTVAAALAPVDWSTNPRRIASLDLGEEIVADAIAGTLAILGTRDPSGSDHRVRIVDLAVPTAPVARGEIAVAAEVLSVAVEGHLAYVALQGSGVLVLDVTDPDAPQSIGAVAAPTILNSAPGAGDLLYVATDTEIRVLDVSDPAAPVDVGSVSVPIPVTIQVIGPDRAIGFRGDYVLVFDLAVPAAPVLAASIEADCCCDPTDCTILRGATGAGSRVWVTWRRQSCVDFNCNCTTYSSGIHGWDLTDAAVPVSLGYVICPSSASSQLRLVGDRLHVFGSGDRVYDVSDPMTPALIHVLPGAGAGAPATIAGRDLIVSTGAALDVFDVTNVERPHGGLPDNYSFPPDAAVGLAARDGSVFSFDGLEVGSCFGGTEICQSVREFVPVGNDLLAGENWTSCGQGYGYFDGFVHEVDATDDAVFVRTNDALFRTEVGAPGDPIAAFAEIPVPHTLAGMLPRDPWLFLAAGASGLSALDLSVDPPVLAYGPAGPDTRAVAAAGAIDVAVGWSAPYDVAALRTLDLSDPTAPISLGEVTWPDETSGYYWPYWVTAGEGVAAVGRYDVADVLLFDVSDPAAPTLAATLLASQVGAGKWRQGGITGGTLYVVATGVGVAAFDVTDPAQPVFRGTLGTDAARHLLATPEAVYVQIGRHVARLPLDAGTDPTAALAPPHPAIAAGIRLTVEPNPFRSGAVVRWALPGSAEVYLTVHDVAGRRVRTLDAPAGASREGLVRWDGRDAMGRVAGPGVYFVRIEAAGESATTKLVRLR